MAYSYSDRNAPSIKRSFNEDDVMLQLPDSIQPDEIAWLSVWSRDDRADLGSVSVPDDIDFGPILGRRPQVSASDMFDNSNAVDLGPLSERAHRVKGNVFLTGQNSLLLEDFSYDGFAPAAFFVVGTSGVPGDSGTILSYPASEKSFEFYDPEASLVRRSFNSEDVMLTLPPEIPADKVVWFSVWCRRFRVNFGSVMVPQKGNTASIRTTETRKACKGRQTCIPASRCQEFQDDKVTNPDLIFQIQTVVRLHWGGWVRIQWSTTRQSPL